MSIEIRRPMISSFSLRLSRGYYATFLFPFQRLNISLSCVPYMSLPLNVARHSLGWGSLGQQLLPPVQLHLDLLHPHLLFPLLRAMCHSGTSWRSFSARMLALIHFLWSHIRWMFVLAVLHSGRRSWVASLLRLLLHLLQWLLILRLRLMMMVMTMILLMMMMMEIVALSMRCLLDTLTICHSWQKEGVVLDIRIVILRES